MRNRAVLSAGVVVCLLAVLAVDAIYGYDPPHDFSCEMCHSVHGALGASLTNAASNANLCTSCHVSGRLGAAKPFVNSMQAVPGVNGTSHSWSGPLVNAALGAEFPTTSAIVTRLENVTKGMASQGSASNTTVYYASGTYTTNQFVGSTLLFYSTGSSTAANKGVQRLVTSNTGTTVNWSPGVPANPALYDKYAIINSSTRLSCSACHSQHSQTRIPWDPYAPGSGSGRHMLRTDNNYNQLCKDCHRVRAQSYNDAKGSGSLVANGTTIFSHPVGDILNSQGYDYFAPLDANGVAQTNTADAAKRFADDKDSNRSNNLILNSSGGVDCMSCHRMHYSDSNPITNDVAP